MWLVRVCMWLVRVCMWLVRVCMWLVRLIEKLNKWHKFLAASLTGRGPAHWQRSCSLAEVLLTGRGPGYRVD